jgi:hypothetical protein
MHPLVGDLSGLKDSEVENKINELSRKYFMTPNPLLREQISLALGTFKEELARRRSAEWQKMMDNQGKDLDKLIKVN